MTQVIYLPKIFQIHWKELELSSGHRPTDGQTDRRTDEQGESSIPPLNFVSGGIINNIAFYQLWLKGHSITNTLLDIPASNGH